MYFRKKRTFLDGEKNKGKIKGKAKKRRRHFYLNGEEVRGWELLVLIFLCLGFALIANEMYKDRIYHTEIYLTVIFTGLLLCSWQDVKSGEIPDEGLIILLLTALLILSIRTWGLFFPEAVSCHHILEKGFLAKAPFLLDGNPFEFPSHGAVPLNLMGSLGQGLVPYLLGFFAVSLPLLALALWKEAFGMGDVKLMAICGLIAGWQRIVLAFGIACILATCLAFPLMLAGRLHRKSRIAFGPFLCIGVLISLLWGSAIFKFLLGGAL